MKYFVRPQLEALDMNRYYVEKDTSFILDTKKIRDFRHT
jgi:hypothetical protein